ncbi:CMGC/MAPK protein kinase [Saprolegnia parasitica CBS 223.65]|uniref:CMGC/MAPK protein kinase n=1 Tax=Saprolegnia parasitica (strain CBS 223.65) TaxID=695850 RepID=A0A067CIE5_SAPPC|nr:CMGC/MAPK protein kinase [Saprolegnia parasitica CBS 223.65]KDO26577.1 CMGC/MAPK protein kinase [Saprolegnia parasitica CBS 223.65]|eukprot:XP_012202719.1 CMGC/MAPK protein kinase [Saprolegnia parasitica CBS 223.65]
MVKQGGKRHRSTEYESAIHQAVSMREMLPTPPMLKRMKSAEWTHEIQPASATSTPSSVRSMDTGEVQSYPIASTPSSVKSMDTSDAMHHNAYCAPTPYGPSAVMAPTPTYATPTQPPHQLRRTKSEPKHQLEKHAQAHAQAHRQQLHRAPSDPTADTAARMWNFENWECGSRYAFVRPMGQGSYGQVAEAYDTVMNRRVAIKRVISVFDRAQDCVRLYREIYILRHLRHANVIALVDVILPPSDLSRFNDLYLVFEYADTDLQKLFCLPQYLNIRHVQVFLHQLLRGLKYLQLCHVIHRDLKPANILLNEDLSLKICDFGLARVYESTEDQEQPAQSASTRDSFNDAGDGQAPKLMHRQMTRHVVSRFYRAPELILLQDYGHPVDMWSVGCIFGELLNMQQENCRHYQDRKPIFPGRSCTTLSPTDTSTYTKEMDQLYVIFNTIGTPSDYDIDQSGRFAPFLRQIPKKPAMDLRELYPGAPLEALDLLRQCLMFNPASRITVDEALNHPFLREARQMGAAPVDPMPLKMPFDDNDERLSRDEHKARIYAEILNFRAVAMAMDRPHLNGDTR